MHKHGIKLGSGVASPTPSPSTKSLRRKLCRRNAGVVVGAVGVDCGSVGKLRSAEVREARRGKVCRTQAAERRTERKVCTTKQGRQISRTGGGKMVFSTMFSCRRVFVKVILLQLIAWEASAAPSPIIRFPGDDTPRTDKEVALVSPAVGLHGRSSPQPL